MDKEKAPDLIPLEGPLHTLHEEATRAAERLHHRIAGFLQGLGIPEGVSYGVQALPNGQVVLAKIPGTQSPDPEQSPVESAVPSGGPEMPQES